MAMASSFGGKLLLVVALQWWTIACDDAVDIANTVKLDYSKKHWKRLKKQDGAIRLVGGRGEHEGAYIYVARTVAAR